jgi:hypothetical protein
VHEDCRVKKFRNVFYFFFPFLAGAFFGVDILVHLHSIPVHTAMMMKSMDKPTTQLVATRVPQSGQTVKAKVNNAKIVMKQFAHAMVSPNKKNEIRIF